jgi:hypothetical protein
MKRKIAFFLLILKLREPYANYQNYPISTHQEASTHFTLYPILQTPTKKAPHNPICKEFKLHSQG